MSNEGCFKSKKIESLCSRKPSDTGVICPGYWARIYVKLHIAKGQFNLLIHIGLISCHSHARGI